jgi:hypothetical protein
MDMQYKQETNGDADGAQVLVGRIVDGEASSADYEAFEAMAGSTPPLWRILVQQHRDAALLARRVEQETVAACAVDVPPDGAARRGWGVALVGWAALLVAALTLWVVLPGRVSFETPAIVPADLSPDDHFDRYVDAPFVLGEMQPHVLQVEEMSDGRMAIRYLRRIEEVVFVDSADDVPVNDRGNLTADPAVLRGEQP